MKVTRDDLAAVFDELVGGKRTRESAEEWAEERMRASDEHRLVYEPRADEGTIRDGIHYLSGVALQSTPGEYLHSDSDFRAYRERAGL